MPDTHSNLLNEVRTLKEEIKQLKTRKKFGLVWEDKPEEVVELCKEKLPVLSEDKTRAIKGNNGPTNIFIEGDNYHALSVLNYTHQGKIDAIYIDPPYNTGARDWKYNNNYVDTSDSFRHSKWISFMYHRLLLARELLSKEGVICVTIDDNELPKLLLLMEEIFGEDKHLGTVVIRNNPKGRMTNKKFSLIHEYAVFFGKTSSSSIKKLPISPEDKTHNYQKAADGSWFLTVNLRKQGVDSTAYNKKGKLSERYFPIYFDPSNGQVSSVKKFEIEIWPVDQKGEKRIWRRGREAIDEMYSQGDLWVKQVSGKYQVYYKFRGGLEGQMPKSMWYDSKFSASEYGTNILDTIMGARETFQYPKSPYAVMESILAITNKKDAQILDFFAGSGTTAQAVIMLNKKDNGHRRFILCTNNENKIAEEVTYPRIKKVMEGVKGLEEITGAEANLRYLKTDFIDGIITDKNKKNLVNKSTEMLCLKEDCFDVVKKGQNFKIFNNNQGKNLGIIYDDTGIEPFKKEVQKLNKKVSTYVFSLDDSAREEEFEDIDSFVELRPIPTAILNVYRRIFK